MTPPTRHPTEPAFRLAEVKPIPVKDVGDTVRGLRQMAQDIEDGKYPDDVCLAWVMDCGDGKVQIGMLGHSPSPGPEAHLLFAVAMRKLEAPSV